MLTESGYPVSVACQAAGIPRSSYYYKPQAKEEDALREAIEEVAAKYPTYGSRRIAAQLGREPYNLQVNRKRVVRLMRELGLVRKPKRKPVRTTDSSHPHRRYPNLVAGLEVSYPDQVWVADITYIRLKKGFVYLAVVMDLFTRGIRGWALSRFLDHDLALEALKMALGKGVAKVHHSDQGVQYAAKEYVELLEKHEVKISMARRGRPDENGYAERVIRTIKEEEVELSEYEGFWDAKDKIREFIEEVYQKKRIHSALGYLTPAEFEAKWYEQEAEAALLSKDGPKPVQFLGSTTIRHRHLGPLLYPRPFQFLPRPLEHGMKLPHIVLILGHLRRHDDLVLCHHKLGVVALHIPLTGLHDPALGVRQVYLGPRVRPGIRGRRPFATSLLPRTFLLPAGSFLLRHPLQLLLGPLEPLQPLVAVHKLLRNLLPNLRLLGRIRRLRLLKHPLHLFLQALVSPVGRKGGVPGHLRPVHHHRPHLDQPCLATQP